MKRLKKYITVLAAIATVCACTGKFEEYNTNSEGVYEEDFLADDNLVSRYFPGLQRSIYFNNDYGERLDWTFQLYQNLNADMFSGMMSSPTPFGSSSNLTYSMVDGWNSYAWNTSNDYIMANIKKVEDLIDKYAERDMNIYRAWVQIIKVACMHRVADLYGPIIYSQYGRSDFAAPYDDLRSVYYQFFEELEAGIEGLTLYEENNQGNRKFRNVDLIYNGNMIFWIKYANTLRLRLAMTIVKAEPEKARLEAEKSVHHKWGVITENFENARVGSMTHPLATISGSWGDCVMSADMESILKGYADKRLERFFRPVAGNGALAGQYKGVRLGVDQEKDVYAVAASAVNVATSTTPVIASAAEAYFLRAEGALRGWNMNGTPQELYEQGIRTSFEQYGISDAEYFTSSNLPADFEDSVIPENSHKAVNLVSPAWTDDCSTDVKLQKIVTQKWLALFPDGAIAWTDYRRTGYPKLFPVVNNYSRGVVLSETGPRRIPYPSNELLDNTENYYDGLSKLGGPDNAATRLWWDTEKENF